MKKLILLACLLACGKVSPTTGGNVPHAVEVDWECGRGTDRGTLGRLGPQFDQLADVRARGIGVHSLGQWASAAEGLDSPAIDSHRRSGGQRDLRGCHLVCL